MTAGQPSNRLPTLVFPYFLEWLNSSQPSAKLDTAGANKRISIGKMFAKILVEIDSSKMEVRSQTENCSRSAIILHTFHYIQCRYQCNNGGN